MLVSLRRVRHWHSLRRLRRSLLCRRDGTFKATEDLTPDEAATTHNNFYEFGTNKSDPACYADSMTTDPWEIKVGGLVNKPGS